MKTKAQGVQNNDSSLAVLLPLYMVYNAILYSDFNDQDSFSSACSLSAKFN